MEATDEASNDVLSPATKKKVRAAVRSSNRVTKKVKKDITSPTSPAKKPAKVKLATPESKKPSGKRSGEVWGKQDQQLFYDALNEYGKDFDSIYKFISTRQKKRGYNPEQILKTREQVRHFYYRAWHKISKWITFKEGIKKSMQEVYALINYGEFRKRFPGCLDPKHGAQLNDLFHTGATSVKVRGKIHKVRTPVCRALKKINKIDDEPKKEDGVQMPEEIVVELRPKSNKDWAYVHSMSHNPRLRMHLKPDRRLSTVLNYAQRKWKPRNAHMRELVDLDIGSIPKLKVSPIGEITPISLKISPPNKWQPAIGLDVVKANLREISFDELKKYSMKRQKQKQSVDEQTSKPKEDIVVEFPDQMDLTSELKYSGAQNNMKSSEIIPIPEIALHCPLESSELENMSSREPHDIESDAVKLDSDEVVVELGGSFANTLECTDAESIDISPEEVSEFEAKFRDGWTEADAHEITIAEIYLILNKPEKIMLHYCFSEESSQDLARRNVQIAMERLLMVARAQFINLAKLNKQNESEMKNAYSKPAEISDGVSSMRDYRRRASCGALTPPISHPVELRIPEPVLVPTLPTLPIVTKPMAVPIAPKPMVVEKPKPPEPPMQQPFDFLAKRPAAPVARNKMRMKKQIRPRSLIAKPSTPRQIFPFTMMSDVQKGLLPVLPGVVARRIGPMPTASITAMPAVSTAVPTVIGLKPDDINKLMVVPRFISPVSAPLQTTSSFLNNNVTHTIMTSSPHVMTSAPHVMTPSVSTSALTVDTADSESRCSISNILDISLPPPDPGVTDADSLINMALENNPTFSEYFQSQKTLVSTPDQSPSKLPDSLFNADGDVSLSHLFTDSPVKRDVTLSAAPFCENSRDSISNKFESQVDSTFQFMMNENSVDYISKFADLAAHMAAGAEHENKDDTIT